MPGSQPSSDPSPTAVTQLLARIRSGESRAGEQLLGLVYEELNVLAQAAFAGRISGHTLQPTALVHEAWIKLAGNLGDLEGRTHFFVVAARAMRQVLADHARGKQTLKRSGPRQRITLDCTLEAEGSTPDGVDLVVLNDLLERLAINEPRHAHIVELRLFGGLSVAEVAEVLEVTERTVYSDWAMAKAWLRRRLLEA